MTLPSAFRTAHVRALDRSPAQAPPPSECLRVDRVAQGSLAAAVGVVAGDQLAEVDGQRASEVDPALAEHFAARRSYRFYSPMSQEETRLEASGIALGIELSPTAQSLAAGFDPDDFDPESLYALWAQGEFAVLGRLSQQAVSRRTPSGLMGRLRGKSGDERNTPALVLLGAALYERGDRGKAQPLFDEFGSEYVDAWTQNYAGILEYYAARDALAAGDEEGALDLAWLAHEHCCCDRTAALVGELTGETPPRHPKLWIGRPYPASYHLPVLEPGALSDGGTHAALGTVLASMGEGQIFLVCLLATYRGNGPYNDFMRRFRNYAWFFPDNLRGLHVITMERERRVDRAYWYEAEDDCRRRGLPFDVLFDPDGEKTMALEPTGSPYVLAVDRNGVVLEEGQLEEVDFWVALGRVGVGCA